LDLAFDRTYEGLKLSRLAYVDGEAGVF